MPIVISDKLHSDQISELTMISDNVKINSIKIKFIHIDFVECAIYRPHSKHIAVEEFTNLLNTFLLNDEIKNSKIIIIGDLDINLLEHTTHPPTNNFLVNLQALNFFPHISRPTRFPDSLQLGDPSLLDHIYTNFNGNFTSGIIHFPVSDHLPIFINITIPSEKPKLHKVEYRNITQTNKQLFSNKLSTVQWNELLTHDVIMAHCILL